MTWIPNSYFTKTDVLEAIQEKEKSFSRILEFQWLSYDEKHDIRHQRTDDLSDQILYNEDFLKINWTNVLYTLLSEAVRNIADHSNSNGYIEIQYIKDTLKKQLHLHFSILDEWLWFWLDEEWLKQLRHTGDSVTMPQWEKKGKENHWIGLSFIKDSTLLSKTDLRLHNKWNLFPINNLWLQPHIKAISDKFGYEGYIVLNSR
jgi:hypothetical protein